MTPDGALRWHRRLGECRRRHVPSATRQSSRRPDKEVSPDRPPLLASPARGAEPIVVVRYGSKMFGANSGCMTTRHPASSTLRSGRPLRARLHSMNEVGTNAAAPARIYMCLYAVNEAVGCRWESRTTTSSAPRRCIAPTRRGSTRRATRRFRFSDGGCLWRRVRTETILVTEASTPATLERASHQSAEPSCRPASDRYRAMCLSGAADASALFGAPSLTWRFGARFFAASIGAIPRGADRRNRESRRRRPRRMAAPVTPARRRPAGRESPRRHSRRTARYHGSRPSVVAR